ncbi:outer membrane biogenesis protein BamB [Novipirellula galeiformis]|uniref:Outer membrane biogenesis protein BamB n=1 Tax=Novipirellula galeiformis TaxID=2528004 RepID=A0A5C6CVL7_9BACT|nr:outer membrane biogenesis protein BamB [Novipirellula galeiformis]
MFFGQIDRFRIFAMVAATCCAGIATTDLMADDWPGWMGPSRDGVYRETGIIDAVPEEGLKVKWRTPIAGGYAGPAVADGRVFVFDYLKTEGEAFNDAGQRANLKGQERLTALDAETGKTLWQYAYDRPYSISYPAGPRCTPTVDGDLVYILGSEGDLQALRVSDGEVVWKRNLPQDLGAEVPIWGFASHPLIDGDTLYTMVGGEGQSIVAFDKWTGEVKWKAIDGNAGYCTPSIIDHGGARQLIVYHPTAVTSLNPTTGSEYWSIPIAPSFDMSIARPMVDGDLMYASGIRSESLMIQLDRDSPKAKEVWRGEPKEAVHSANATPIFTGGVVYGTDCVQGNLIAVDAKDGSRLWSTFEATKPDEKRFIKHGTAFLTRLADTDRYLIFSETGDLQMAKLTAAGFEDLGRFHVLEPTAEAFGRSVVWSHPAYAGQTAFARNDHEIVAVDLAK